MNTEQRWNWTLKMRLGAASTVIASAVVLALGMITASSARAQTFSLLYSFTGDGDMSPYAGLTFDSVGNLYGTTTDRGGCGTVFELTPSANGTWTETVLYSFGGGSDGAVPSASLIFDAHGNLYGTTTTGGAGCDDGYCGTVFELTPSADGAWTENVLHSFRGRKASDGVSPNASLIFDADANLYGTTASGGGGEGHGGPGCGTVFELVPGPHGKWTEKVLYRFNSNGQGGILPFASLNFDGAGNLYGTTWSGGTTGCSGWRHRFGCGTVFELSPGSGGTWTEKVLHTLSKRPDGRFPYAGLVFDAAGNLYGTTVEGGDLSCSPDGCGTVWKLTPHSRWQ